MDSANVPVSMPDEEQRHQGWWRQYAVVGLTPDQIATQEAEAGRSVTLEDVEEGLVRFAARLTTEFSRQDLIAKHKAFVAGMRAIVWRNLQWLQKSASQNGGIGIPTEEVTEEYVGNRLVSRKVKRRWRSPVSEITQLQRIAIDCSRFEATLDGLLQQPEFGDRPSMIEIEIPGLMDNIFTHPDDAPVLREESDERDQTDVLPEAQ